MKRFVAFIRFAVLRLPILWGGLAAAAFYMAAIPWFTTDSFVRRYFAMHPVEYITTVLSCVGVAALVGKGIDLVLQRLLQSMVKLGPPPAGGQDPAQIQPLLEKLNRAPVWVSEGYLVRRLRNALVHIQRTGSPAELDDQLRYLSEQDAEQAYADLSLVRMIIWAIPILGFLGTVIGITLAIANLSPQALENSLPEVISGLGVAFDTTALALSLTMVLMFLRFMVDRLEHRVLAAIDSQAARELVGRFQARDAQADAQTAAVQRIAESTLRSVEQLTQQQTEAWRHTMDATHQDWVRIADQISQQVKTTFQGAVATGLERHAQTLGRIQEELAQQHTENWERLAESLEKAADGTSRQQAELARQAQLLLRIAEGTDHVRNLESTLNNNLEALAGSKHFEQMVHSLSATIQLLNARLSPLGMDHRPAELHSQTTSDAA